MEGRQAVIRIERRWALDAVAMAEVLREQDPRWRTEVFDLADGKAVLCGSGLYVNQVLAAGLEETVTDEHFELLERTSQRVGVVPAFEVTAATKPAVLDRLAERGYRRGREAAALVRPLGDVIEDEAEPAIVIEEATGDLLSIWQATSALALGHLEPDARRASDAFAQAADRVDDPGLLLARSVPDGRPIGCASLAIRDGVATLGGMSTLPEHRQQGVQGALIRHRLRVAREWGCEIAASTAAVGERSERNLLRHGFHRLHVKATFEQQPTLGPRP